MSFIEKLMQDAQPKAQALRNATNNVINKTADNKAVKVAKNIGYKSLVSTVGVVAVLSKPVVDKVVVKLNELAADPKASK